jgi:hypothetical protein
MTDAFCTDKKIVLICGREINEKLEQKNGSKFKKKLLIKNWHEKNIKI